MRDIETKRRDVDIRRLVTVGVTREHAERIHRYIHQYKVNVRRRDE